MNGLPSAWIDYFGTNRLLNPSSFSRLESTSLTMGGRRAAHPGAASAARVITGVQTRACWMAGSSPGLEPCHGE